MWYAREKALETDYLSKVRRSSEKDMVGPRDGTQYDPDCLWPSGACHETQQSADTYQASRRQSETADGIIDIADDRPAGKT